jgi:preprotein translocase subunit SecB
MAETNGSTPDAPQAAPAAQPAKMQILAQFIRDMSFENMLAQKGAQGEVIPEMAVQVNLDAKKRQAQHQYEVVMKFRIEAKNKGKADTLYLLEIEYGGVFHIENVPEAQLHPVLLIECPRLLFPYLRRIVSDITRDGGFPPVNLEPVDFLAIYRQQIAQRVVAAKAPETAQ